jgi:hypothetical protein
MLRIRFLHHPQRSMIIMAFLRWIRMALLVLALATATTVLY